LFSFSHLLRRLLRHTEISHPLLIRSIGPKLPIQEIGRDYRALAQIVRRTPIDRPLVKWRANPLTHWGV